MPFPLAAYVLSMPVRWYGSSMNIRRGQCPLHCQSVLSQLARSKVVHDLHQLRHASSNKRGCILTIRDKTFFIARCCALLPILRDPCAHSPEKSNARTPEGNGMRRCEGGTKRANRGKNRKRFMVSADTCFLHMKEARG